MPRDPNPFIAVKLRTKSGTIQTFYTRRTRTQARRLPAFQGFDTSPQAQRQLSKLNGPSSPRVPSTPNAPSVPRPGAPTRAQSGPVAPTRATPGRGVPTRASVGSRRGRGAPRETVEGEEFVPLNVGRYTTWFKGFGTVEMEGYGISPEYRPDLINTAHPEEAAPAAWYSNQGEILGRVKFEGIRSERELVALLNRRLQFVGEESGRFDFRNAYPTWEYRYQVVEHVGGTDRVVVDRIRRG